MKALLVFVCGACLLSSLASAQTTMPAMGANTPRGEVAKTDASLNPRKAADTTGRKASRQPNKMPKTKMKKSTM